MFYRRKLILALLQIFEGKIDKISLQKLFFIFSQRQSKAEYDFIPYLYGCFSYSLNADLVVMVKKDLILETHNHFISKENEDYLGKIKALDQEILKEVKSLHGKKDANELMKYTYINFPYWAIKSRKAKQILSPKEYNKVQQSKPRSVETALFTIGYEGISLEEYLNRLIKNDIKVLVDVRSNPLSMKYGFSKSQLERYCSSLNIGYIHFPEVGIQSKQRQQLYSQADYDRLFDTYRQNNLPKTTASQLSILSLLKEHHRIALTCFEANICQCHRKHLAEAIQNLPDFKYKVIHI
ncbi:MAG: DUF488 domain-containing protein [Bernardetiaceae bacterium]|jgi:uncharacterized protein (DUF488 family)|nr:DUF488 domain-containing protein [Bernardetiaceae bacterium]